MALKRKLQSLDEVDESLHSLYREDGDGYVLDLEGDDVGDASALKRALEHERRQRREATSAKTEMEKRLADLEAKLSDDRREPESSAPQDVDFKSRVEAATKPLREQLDKLSKLYEDEKKARRDSEVARKRSETFGKARQVASQHVREDLLDDFLAARVERLLQFDDEAGEFVPKRDGELIYDPDNPGRPASIEQVIRQLVEDKSAAPYRRPSRGVDLGEGAPANGIGAHVVISASDARDPQKFQRVREAAQKAGKEVVIA